MWKPERILVTTDFSPTAEAAVAVARNLAARMHAGLDLMHSVPDPSKWMTGYAVLDELLVPGPDPMELRGRVLEKLEKIASEISPSPSLHAVFGDPAEEIVALREILGAGLVVMGARGLRGVRRFLLGSVSDRVLRRPGPPLLLVREAPPGAEFKNILVALENPREAKPWLDVALSLAHDLRSEVTLLHVLPPKGYVSDARHVELYPEDASSELERRVAERDPSIPIRITLRRGDPVTHIPALARKLGSDLVVMGAERHTDGFPGRVTDRVARTGLPALLTVWPDAEPSPD